MDVVERILQSKEIAEIHKMAVVAKMRGYRVVALYLPERAYLEVFGETDSTPYLYDTPVYIGQELSVGVTTIEI